MTLVYVAHPIAGDVKSNLEDLARIMKMLNTTFPEHNFYAPYYIDVVALDDSVPEQRERGIQNDLALIVRGVFDEIWLTGKGITNGMIAEMAMFKIQGKQIRNFINHF